MQNWTTQLGLASHRLPRQKLQIALLLSCSQVGNLGSSAVLPYTPALGIACCNAKNCLPRVCPLAAVDYSVAAGHVAPSLANPLPVLFPVQTLHYYVYVRSLSCLVTVSPTQGHHSSNHADPTSLHTKQFAEPTLSTLICIFSVGFFCLNHLFASFHLHLKSIRRWSVLSFVYSALFQPIPAPLPPRRQPCDVDILCLKLLFFFFRLPHAVTSNNATGNSRRTNGVTIMAPGTTELTTYHPVRAGTIPYKIYIWQGTLDCLFASNPP
jgi:hypothetical protein